MKYACILSALLLCSLCVSSHATSFGRVQAARIASIDGKPALCLPQNTKGAFPVGWITLGESYIRRPGSWSLERTDSAKPLLMKAGDCLVYGDVPEGFKLSVYPYYEIPELVLRVNHTYVFTISSAEKPRDRYDAVFCISEDANGTRRYEQYERLPDASEIIPACDAKLHGNAPEQYWGLSGE